MPIADNSTLVSAICCSLYYVGGAVPRSVPSLSIWRNKIWYILDVRRLQVFQRKIFWEILHNIAL